MFRKLTGWILLAAMLLPLAACGTADTSQKEDDVTNAPASEAVSTEAETEPPEYTAPDKKFGGATFTFLDYQTEDYAYSLAAYSDIHADTMTGDNLRDAQYERNQKAQDVLDFKLATHPVGGRNRNQNDTELTNLILAADTSVDAAFVFAGKMPKLMTTPGYLLMLNDVDSLNLDGSWWDQNVREEMTIRGGIKAITGNISFYYQYAPNVIYFNASLADTIHLENLYDTVRAGKWTIDKMMEASEAAATDLDGDGKMTEKDRYGFVGQGSFFYPLYISAGCDFVRHTPDGGFAFCYNNERSASLVEKYVPKFNDASLCLMADKVSQFGFSNSDSWIGLFAPMFAGNQTLFYLNQLILINELRAQEPDFGILPYPKYDENQEQYRTLVNGSWATLLCLPATCTKTDMAGYVFDAMGYYSKELVTPQIIDKNVRGKSIRDEDSAEMLTIILNNKKLESCDLFGWGGVVGNFCNLAKQNNTNFASMAASTESAAQAALAETLTLFAKEK